MSPRGAAKGLPAVQEGLNQLFPNASSSAKDLLIWSQITIKEEGTSKDKAFFDRYNFFTVQPLTPSSEVSIKLMEIPLSELNCQDEEKESWVSTNLNKMIQTVSQSESNSSLLSLPPFIVSKRANGENDLHGKVSLTQKLALEIQGYEKFGCICISFVEDQDTFTSTPNPSSGLLSNPNSNSTSDLTPISNKTGISYSNSNEDIIGISAIDSKKVHLNDGDLNPHFDYEEEIGPLDAHYDYDEEIEVDQYIGSVGEKTSEKNFEVGEEGQEYYGTTDEENYDDEVDNWEEKLGYGANYASKGSGGKKQKQNKDQKKEGGISIYSSKHTRAKQALMEKNSKNR